MRLTPTGLILLALAMLCLCSCPQQQQAGQTATDQGSSAADGKDKGAVALDMQRRSPELELPFELPDVPAPDPATELATLAVLGNFRGFQKPCSCTPEQDGGLARMGSVLHRVDEEGLALSAQAAIPDDANLPEYDVAIPGEAIPQPLWLVDLGNFSWTQLHFPGLRSRTHLQILSAIGARAAIPGASELSLGLSDAVAAFADSPLPLVSCNLVVDQSDIEILPSLQLADNWYLVGVSSSEDGQGMHARADWWQLADSASSLTNTLASLPADCHIIVAGANLDPALAETALADPRVNCCIGVPFNRHRQNADEPRMYRDPLPKATVMDMYSLDAPGNDVTDWTIRLDEQYPDDPRVMELIKHEGKLSRDKLREQRMARAAAAGGTDKPEFGMSDKFLPQKEHAFSYEDERSYVGGESCLHCHRDAADSWRGTKHAQAFHSLESEGQADVLDCLACHTTGLLLSGGYDPLEPGPAMAAVGCESCHGPGSHHVHAMQDQLGKPEGLLIDRMPVNGCVQCHDPYNSPNFSFDEYWERIRH
ncbi:MAG: cytochrome c family protein [Planctomycetales bacterium]|nr:cytochrome c family protein [bacterium]UNM08628.1 MAG: cytochrome c family protein [Planctomycetales bacterium]